MCRSCRILDLATIDRMFSKSFYLLTVEILKVYTCLLEEGTPNLYSSGFSKLLILQSNVNPRKDCVVERFDSVGR